MTQPQTSEQILAFAKLSEAQREQAAEILVQAFTHEPSAWKTMDEARTEVATFLRGKERMAWAVIENGKLIGWIGAIVDSVHQWELHPLAVDPAAQNCGYGTRLVRALEGAAKSAGVATIWLGTDDGFGGTNLFDTDLYPDVLGRLKTLTPATRHPFSFYQRLGYAVVGVLPDANGFGRHDILMAKRI